MKKRLVVGLAQYERPAELARVVKDEFGLTEDIPIQQVVAFDPSRRAGAELGKDLKKLFAEARAAFLDETVKLPAMHRAWRIGRLQSMAEKAYDRGNYGLAKDLLRQVAEEMGGRLTNGSRVELSGDALAKLLDMTPEQIDAVLRGTE